MDNIAKSLATIADTLDALLQVQTEMLERMRAADKTEEKPINGYLRNI
jgi:hypothetical protein